VLKSRVFRIVFLVAGLWFLIQSFGFFRNDAWLGGSVFAVAGAFFLGLAVFRSR
jgi:hypothetical protein